MKIYQIGRKNSPIIIPDTGKQISRRHAELTITDKNTFYLVDANSQNGTFVERNGQWVRLRQAQVVPTDRIRFGARAVVTVAEILRQVSHEVPAPTPAMLAARN